MIDWISDYVRNPNSAPRVDSRSVAVFTRQLATLLLGGVPILKAMEVLAYQPDNPRFGQVIEVCTKQICGGSRFSSSLRMFPTIFPSTYVALVRSGEETGRLHYVMEQLAIWLERRDRLNRVVKKALAYPVFVAIITAILTVALFRTVIPAILKTVVDLGVVLPWPTRLLVGLVELAGSPAVWIATVVATAAMFRYVRSEEGYRRSLSLACRLPWLGPLLIGSACSRFANTMAMLVASGVDLVRACRISCEASGLPLMEDDAPRIVQQLTKGEFLSQTINASKLYPNVLGAMIDIGEESGQLAAVLAKCAQLLEEDTLDQVANFTNLLEPIILGFLSAGVGFIVIAVMLPISTLVSSL